MVELRPLLPLVLGFALCACHACDDERTVPFKRDAPPVATTDAGQAETTPTRDTSFVAAQGQALQAGSQTVELGGATVRVAQGELRAAIEVDLDADGDADALLVRTLGDGAIEFAMASRDARGLDALVTVAPLLDASAACPIAAASLHTIADSHVEARVELACAPPADGATVPNEAEHHAWVATREAKPRVVMHLAWTSKPSAERDAIGGVAIVGRDFDDDGHGDVEVHVEHGADELVLEMLSRAAGLAADRDEPEATLGAMAQTARGLLAKDPTTARQRAQATLDLHATVCREPGVAALWVDETQGLTCGESRAAGRAAAIAAAALARSNAPIAALEAFAQIDAPGRAAAEVDRKLALDALDKTLPNAQLRWQKGPTLIKSTGPAVQRPALSFIDEGSLLLHANVPQRYDLQTGTTEPAGLPNDTLLTDPTGKYAAVEVIRSCDGYHVRIVRTDQVIGATIGGASVAEPLVQAHAAPQGASCPQLPKHLRNDDGGLRVIDWTQAGIVLARRSQLFQLPLDAQLQANGPAAPIGPADSLRPRLRGALDESGHKLAVVTALGVAIVDRAAGTVTRVGLPQGVTLGGVSDVVLSPSGTRLALVHGGSVYVASPAAAAPNPAAPAAAPSPPAAPPAPIAPPAPPAPPSEPPAPPPPAPATNDNP